MHTRKTGWNSNEQKVGSWTNVGYNLWVGTWPRSVLANIYFSSGRGAAMIIESLRLFYHIRCFKCCVCRYSQYFWEVCRIYRLLYPLKNEWTNSKALNKHKKQAKLMQIYPATHPQDWLILLTYKLFPAFNSAMGRRGQMSGWGTTDSIVKTATLTTKVT